MKLAFLIERVDNLIRASDKLEASFERALDKQAVDTKERLNEIKSDVKETNTKLTDMKSSIDSFKGAMKVMGGIYALALIVVSAFLAWYLRPAPATPAPPAAPSGFSQPAQK